MASKLKQLQSKACQASQFVSKHGTTYYRQLLEENKQYIQEPPTVEKCDLLSKQLFYTRLARNAISDQTHIEKLLFEFSFFINELAEWQKEPYRNREGCIPGRYESFWKELDYVKQLWKNRKELTVEDVSIAALFGLECYGWYCVGEIVGRGFTITGYYV